MKTAGLITLLLLVSGWLIQAEAQTSQNPGEVFIQQASFDHNDAAKRFTADFTTMFNLDFDAFAGSEEASNTAIVNQYGNNNTTGLLQNGSDNQFILNLEGNANSVNGLQQGDENSLRIDLIGSANNQTFTQIGNNLTMELVDDGSGGVPLQIEQRGDGASVVIENY